MGSDKNLRMWSGEDWQQYASKLLRLKYGNDYIPIPDKDKGDMGLEGYTLSGLAFQCYAPQEPLGVTDRYAKQRAKITTDVQKLKSNSASIASLLKATKLTRWVLVVPIHDSKELVKHASNKSDEIKSWGLPFIADDFHILVQTDDDFPIEQQQLLKAGLQRFNIEYEKAEIGQVVNWAGDHSSFVGRLTEKLKKAMAGKSEAEIEKVRNEMIRLYIDGANCLNVFKKDYPELYEKAYETKMSKEGVLVVEMGLASGAPTETIKKLITDLEKRFRVELPNFPSSEYELLAHECIADWLLRCPLDF